jgi:hypothetical protein
MSDDPKCTRSGSLSWPYSALTVLNATRGIFTAPQHHVAEAQIASQRTAQSGLSTGNNLDQSPTRKPALSQLAAFLFDSMTASQDLSSDGCGCVRYSLYTLILGASVSERGALVFGHKCCRLNEEN